MPLLAAAKAFELLQNFTSLDKLLPQLRLAFSARGETTLSEWSMKVAISIVALIAFCFCVSSSCRAQSIAGDWIGGYQLNGKWTAVLAHFKSEQASVKGTFEIESPDETKTRVD